ncbi:MAG: xylulose kinase [Actinobacteria bacterium]|nr:xylulose kinase [Actinomycetota bacterium]
MADVTVGLDIGTTSVKAVAVNADGDVLARARVPHEVRTPAAGCFEHDVNQAWRSGVVEALRRVAGNLTVAAVNVAAMVPSLGAVDGAGRALGPGLLYGDKRGEHASDSTQPGDSGELLAFLAWQAAEYPDAHGFWPAQAVANNALCGVGAIDSSTAMTAHPLFDYTQWDSALAKNAGASVEQLPTIVAGYNPAGEIADGPATGALVGAGTIDAFGEQLVAGADGTGDVLVLCGTTLITWGVIDEEAHVDGLWTIPHTARGKLLVGGPSNAGGLFLERAKQWVGADFAAAAAVSADDLPVWLPYVRGERTPLHRRDLRASINDAALHHGPEHLLRAAYEASAFVVRHHIDLGHGAGLRATRIVATGGGTRDELWIRALADCTGLPVHVAANAEGAAVGSAFMARCVAGLEKSTRDAGRWARTGRIVDPDPTWVAAASSRYERFRELTQAALDATP